MIERAERVDWWSLTDEQLLQQCATDRYRASGPGGQKRNKTDSAVRLRHQPTGLIVTATDSRSQHENRARALRRLRAALAYEVRQPIQPEVLAAALVPGWLELPVRNDQFLPLAAAVLDVFGWQLARVAPSAQALGVSTGQLIRFFARAPDLWTACQRLRQTHDQKPLRRV